MTGRERSVFFLEATLVEPDGSVVEIDPGFWERLHARLRTTGANKRFLTLSQIRYGGAARSHPSPAVDFIYLGKRRRRSDFPDHAVNDEQDEVALDVPGDLVEPLYIVPVTGTNYAAFMRTSGGPTFDACERWVSHQLDLKEDSTQFELRPYVRRDAVERLRNASGVARLNLVFEPGSLDGQRHPSGQLAEALRLAESIGGAGASIEFGVTFGRATPSEHGAEAYARELEKILQVAGIRRATATLLNRKPAEAPGRAPKYARDKVNFIRDQVVHRVTVGDSPEESRTPSALIHRP